MAVARSRPPAKSTTGAKASRAASAKKMTKAAPAKKAVKPAARYAASADGRAAAAGKAHQLDQMLERARSDVKRLSKQADELLASLT